MPSEAPVPEPRRANGKHDAMPSGMGCARKPSSKISKISRTTERSRRPSLRIMTPRRRSSGAGAAVGIAAVASAARHSDRNRSASDPGRNLARAAGPNAMPTAAAPTLSYCRNRTVRFIRRRFERQRTGRPSSYAHPSYKPRHLVARLSALLPAARQPRHLRLRAARPL